MRKIEPSFFSKSMESIARTAALVGALAGPVAMESSARADIVISPGREVAPAERSPEIVALYGEKTTAIGNAYTHPEQVAAKLNELVKARFEYGRHLIFFAISADPEPFLTEQNLGFLKKFLYRSDIKLGIEHYFKNNFKRLAPAKKQLKVENLASLLLAADPEWLLMVAENFIDLPRYSELLKKAAKVLKETDKGYKLFQYAQVFSSQSFAGSVLKEQVGGRYEDAIEHYQNYRNIPEAKEILGEAVRLADKNGEASVLLRFAENFLDLPGADGIIRKNAKNQPALAISSFKQYQRLDSAKEILRLAVQDLLKDEEFQPQTQVLFKEASTIISVFGPEEAMSLFLQSAKYGTSAAVAYYKSYAFIPKAREVLDLVMEKDPGAFVVNFSSYATVMPNVDARRILEKAVVADPAELHRVEVWKDVGGTLEKSSDPVVLKILDTRKRLQLLRRSQFGSGDDFNGVDLLLALNSDQPVQLRPNNKDQTSFYFRQLIKIQDRDNLIGSVGINYEVSSLAGYISEKIDDSHEDNDTERFLEVNNFSARELRTVIIGGGDALYTSSFNGLFNRLLKQLKKENLSGSALFPSGRREDEFRFFFKQCATYKRLGDFLSTMNQADQDQLLERFVSGLHEAKDPLLQAAIIADTFAALPPGHYHEVLRMKLKHNFDTVSQKTVGTKLLYEVLNEMFARQDVGSDKWIRDIRERYRLRDFTKIGSEEFFDSNGVNRQVHIFYDDEDGKSSFAHFQAEYAKDKKWKISDQGAYIVMQTENEKGRKIEIYAGKPEEKEGVLEKINQDIVAQGGGVIQGGVHHGHSYHFNTSFENMPQSLRFFWIGSCGGFYNTSKTVDHFPQAHLVVTKGTGTMFINDPVLKLFNDEMLDKGTVVWESFWQKISKRFSRNKDFDRYVPPHRNLGALFLQAYKYAERQNGKPAEAKQKLSAL